MIVLLLQNQNYEKNSHQRDYIFLFSYFLESMFSLLLQNLYNNPLIVGR